MMWIVSLVCLVNFAGPDLLDASKFDCIKKKTPISVLGGFFKYQSCLKLLALKLETFEIINAASIRINQNNNRQVEKYRTYSFICQDTSTRK